MLTMTIIREVAVGCARRWDYNRKVDSDTAGRMHDECIWIRIMPLPLLFRHVIRRLAKQTFTQILQSLNQTMVTS